MLYKNQNVSTLATNIKNGIEARLRDLHTAMPGIIESFNPTEQTASIQPAIKRVFKTQEADKEILVPIDLPILINVPVIQPRGGGFSLTFPISKDDECLLIFCERSIDYWHQHSGLQIPGGKRFHHLSDAIAYVGLSSIPKKVPNYDSTNTQLKKDDGSVILTLKENGDFDIYADEDINQDASNININVSGSATIEAGTTASITAGTSATIEAPTINLNGAINMAAPGGGATTMTMEGTINQTGSQSVSGDVVASGISLNSHNHSGSPTAPDGPVSNTGGPQ